MNCFYQELTLILSSVLWSVCMNEATDFCAENLDDEFCLENVCGTVAQPPGLSVFLMNGTGLESYNKENESHNKHGSKVWYNCSNENDILVGNRIRECDQGRWLGEVPRCANNLINETQISLIQIMNPRQKTKLTLQDMHSIALMNKYNTLGAFTPPVALQPKDCVSWGTGEQQTWAIHLSSEVNVQYIRFKLFAENLQQFWIIREFAVKVFLNRNVDCALSLHPDIHPDINLDKNDSNQEKNKNYLTLDFECFQEMKNQTSSEKRSKKYFNKITVNFMQWNKMSKIQMISLCGLRLYQFDDSCGQPDYPLKVQVRRSFIVELNATEQYEHLCNDNEHRLEGKTHIRCGPNGKWMDEFPFCVSNSYCKELTYDSIDRKIIIEYENVIYNDLGEFTVPNGKMARLSCNNSAENRTEYRLQGISSLLCKDGKWHGINEMPECLAKHYFSQFPDRIVGVLSTILIVCVVFIVILVFLMVRTRRAVRIKNMNGVNREYYENDYNLGIDDNKSQIYGDIPHIYYSCDDMDSTYGMHNNSAYRDDLSDKFLEIEKTNSIYSNL